MLINWLYITRPPLSHTYTKSSTQIEEDYLCLELWIGMSAEWLNFSSCQTILKVSQRGHRLVQRGTSKGLFTVKSAYTCLNCTGQHFGSGQWKHVWKVKILLKVACFRWLVVRMAVLRHDNVMRGLPLCSRCFMCSRESETVNHLFLHCQVTVRFYF